MNNFFVQPKIKKARLDVCRSCDWYFSPTGTCRKCGCFMTIKASIGVMSCPINKWKKTNEIQKKDVIPKDLMVEARSLWEGIKTGKAINKEYKRKLVDLYNTIFGTGYNRNTSCTSCLNTMREGIKKIIQNEKES